MVLSKLKQIFLGGGRANIKQRFDIKSKSSMGSMSQVYRAFDKQSKKQVCLKILDKAKTAKFEARFVGRKKPPEGEISLDLHHPHVVETFEHGLTTNGEVYLVQEWVDGTGLRALIGEHHERLEGNRLAILSQVADAVEYMHQDKYLHRDICPRNVLVTAQIQVKLIDFGLTLPYRPEFCRPGNLTGTPQYLAPEIMKRSPTDHRVDLFALGVTAYETFTGQLPWGEYDSPDLLYRSMVARAGSDPREHLPHLDEATALFLMKAIEREPAKRFQTAAAFHDAIKKLPKKW